tara:strand:+ start:878 stop:1297 length:420 start_codon:yes stop_codon:yes gene_type:complete
MNKIKDIIKDVVENLHYHEKNMKMVGKDYYSYDRDDFIKRWKKDYDTPLNEKEIYDEDIESISTHIIQMKLGHIIYIDNDGKDIRNQKVIWEKKTLPLMKQKEIEWERTSKELRQLISKVQKKIKKEKEQNDIINRKFR